MQKTSLELVRFSGIYCQEMYRTTQCMTIWSSCHVSQGLLSTVVQSDITTIGHHRPPGRPELPRNPFAAVSVGRSDAVPDWRPIPVGSCGSVQRTTWPAVFRKIANRTPEEVANIKKLAMAWRSERAAVEGDGVPNFVRLTVCVM